MMSVWMINDPWEQSSSQRARGTAHVTKPVLIAPDTKEMVGRRLIDRIQSPRETTSNPQHQDLTVDLPHYDEDISVYRELLESCFNAPSSSGSRETSKKQGLLPRNVSYVQAAGVDGGYWKAVQVQKVKKNSPKKKEGKESNRTVEIKKTKSHRDRYKAFDSRNVASGKYTRTDDHTKVKGVNHAYSSIDNAKKEAALCQRSNQSEKELEKLNVQDTAVHFQQLIQTLYRELSQANINKMSSNNRLTLLHANHNGTIVSVGGLAYKQSRKTHKPLERAIKQQSATYAVNKRQQRNREASIQTLREFSLCDEEEQHRNATTRRRPAFMDQLMQRAQMTPPLPKIVDETNIVSIAEPMEWGYRTPVGSK